MNREHADNLLNVYGRPVAKDQNGKVILSFARQDITDIEEIEKLTTEELIDQWKGLCLVNHIMGCVSLNDLQRLDLLELEMDSRTDINHDELKQWFDKKSKEAEEYQRLEEEQWNKEQEKNNE